MVYLLEEAIRQVLIIEQNGARVFHVDYARLVDDTERLCREISAFLGVPYDPAMVVNGRWATALLSSLPSSLRS
jgi:hypothetical protein